MRRLAIARAATAQFDRLRRTRFGRPDGLAATFFLAELHRQEGRAAAAVELYRRPSSRRARKTPTTIRGCRWSEFEARLDAAAADLTAQGHFAEALELGQAMRPLASEVARAPPADRGSSGVGQATARAGRFAADAGRRDDTAEARQHLRQAGADGEQLAELEHRDAELCRGSGRRGRELPARAGLSPGRPRLAGFLRQNPPQRRARGAGRPRRSAAGPGRDRRGPDHAAGCRDEFPTHPATYRARLAGKPGLAGEGRLAASQGAACRQSVSPRADSAKQRMARFAVCPGPAALSPGRRGRDQEPHGRRRPDRMPRR